jgi:hypothetical protein
MPIAAVRNYVDLSIHRFELDGLVYIGGDIHCRLIESRFRPILEGDHEVLVGSSHRIHNKVPKQNLS